MIAVGLFVAFSCAPIARTQRIEDDFSNAVNPHEVSDLFFVEAFHGWITVQDHKTQTSRLFRTSDGGRSWAELIPPNGLFRVFFVTWEVGWGLVKRDESTVYLFRSSDGGTSWKQSSTQPAVVQADYGPAPMDTLAFGDEQNGWFQGGLGCPMMKTSDGGETLVSEQNVVGTPCYGVYVSKRTGILVYGDRFVTRSYDGGVTWDDIPFGPEGLGLRSDYFDIDSAFFRSDGRGWLVGTDFDSGIILATTDFGRHWRKALASKKINRFDSVSFWDASHGCATGILTYLACTEDGGKTWKTRRTLPPADRSINQAPVFKKLVMLASGRGWALRFGGFLYQTNDGGQTWQGVDPIKEFAKH